ncbi:hypothetical protein ACQKE9_14815 [Shewanella vesiculosa]|uniref:hypothetical protein n=1 Tax=Shewanella vesiculosa TaxID=518738 RepID=UPI003D020CFC
MTVSWPVNIVILSIIVAVNTIALIMYWIKSAGNTKPSQAKTKVLGHDKKC